MYCGDNGTCPTAARTGLTLREEKGSLYEGGIRVPGLLEWPAIIDKPASASAVSVTTDILPTLVELTGQTLPERPIDGVSLVPLFSDPSHKREEPLCFWMFETRKVFVETPRLYIDPELQEGTTPLKKMISGMAKIGS